MLPPRLRDVLVLTFNFVSAVGIIFINKWVFDRMHFKWTTALTVLHYLLCMAGLEVLCMCGVFERRTSPLNSRLIVLASVVGLAPALNNLSLRLNNVGFYTVVKLLVTPVIVVMERVWYGAALSTPRAAALAGICVGVAFATVNDVSLNLAGCMVAVAWTPVAATYKVLWSRVAKEEDWNTLALMQRVMPLSTVLMALWVPILDPPGLLSFAWSAERAALITLSGVGAFCVNWSGFLVLGACSALSHSVLGQVKSIDRKSVV